MRDFKRDNTAKCIELESNLQQSRKGLFDLAERIGKLEVLNDVGGGRIREVLETLAITSNSFRTNNTVLGSLGSAVFNDVDEGAFSILDEMGIGESIRDAVAAFQPSAVNFAVGSARVLADDIRRGRFELQDIPNRVQDFQNVEQLARGIFVSNPNDDGNRFDVGDFNCRPSPFAVDMVHAYGPKQNFSFFVEIKLAAPYTNQANYKDVEKHLAFIVKSTSRPAVNYDYEDVNYYNFRTQIIQKQSYQPISMRFMDDTQNYAARFHAMYIKAMSPINNISDPTNASPKNLPDIGMNFDDSGNFDSTQNNQSSGVGVLRRNATNSYDTVNIIESISLYHVSNGGNHITSYVMFNPKITSLQPSDLTMEETGNGSEFTLDFTYDALYIDPAVPISNFGIDRIRRLTGDVASGGVGANYPLNPVLNGTLGGDGSVNTTAPSANSELLNTPIAPTILPNQTGPISTGSVVESNPDTGVQTFTTSLPQAEIIQRSPPVRSLT